MIISINKFLLITFLSPINNFYSIVCFLNSFLSIFTKLVYTKNENDFSISTG